MCETPVSHLRLAHFQFPPFNSDDFPELWVFKSRLAAADFQHRLHGFVAYLGELFKPEHSRMLREQSFTLREKDRD